MSVMPPGEPIAQSSMADIYAWGKGQILKLFHNWVPAYGVEHIARTARAVADVARSELILAGISVSKPSYGSLIDQFGKAYLKRYFELRPGHQKQLIAWRPVVAAVRLSDSIPELQEWLLTQIRAGLALHE